MYLKNGVLILSDSDYENIQEQLTKVHSVVDEFEKELKTQQIKLSEINAVQFNPRYFSLSGKLIVGLAQVRLRQMKKNHLANL